MAATATTTTTTTNTKVLKEAKSTSAAETTAAVEASEAAVSSVKCYCCGLTEECTPRYIDRVRERYEGRWICGLCAEAVKEEALKSPKEMSTDEALSRHVSFFQKFRSSSCNPPNKPTQELILAMKQLLFRSLDSSSPRSSSRNKEPLTCRPLGRSHSCFSTMPRTTTQAQGHAERETRESGRSASETRFLYLAFNLRTFVCTN